MNLDGLYQRALNFEFLEIEEGIFLFEQAPLTDLMYIANELRKKQVPHGKVTWQIDRNVNTTNVCIANCKFCNFYRIPADTRDLNYESYFSEGKDVSQIEEYHSDNTERLDIEGTKKMLLKLDIIRNDLKLYVNESNSVSGTHA